MNSNHSVDYRTSRTRISCREYYSMFHSLRNNFLRQNFFVIYLFNPTMRPYDGQEIHEKKIFQTGFTSSSTVNLYFFLTKPEPEQTTLM